MNDVVCLALAPENGSDTIRFEQHHTLANEVPVEQKEWAHKWEKRHSTFSIINTPDYIDIKSLEVAAKKVFKKIWKEVPLDFSFSKNDDSADFKIEFVETDSVFEKNLRALAYAYLPVPGSTNNGIIRFSLKYLWGLIEGMAGSKRVYNFIHVLLHEALHSLGLLHDEHDDTSDVMDPIYNGKNLEMSAWDKLRLKRMLGNRIFANWRHYARWDRLLKILVRRRG